MPPPPSPPPPPLPRDRHPGRPHTLAAHRHPRRRKPPARTGHAPPLFWSRLAARSLQQQARRRCSVGGSAAARRSCSARAAAAYTYVHVPQPGPPNPTPPQPTNQPARRCAPLSPPSRLSLAGLSAGLHPHGLPPPLAALVPPGAAAPADSPRRWQNPPPAQPPRVSQSLPQGAGSVPQAVGGCHQVLEGGREGSHEREKQGKLIGGRSEARAARQPALGGGMWGRPRRTRGSSRPVARGEGSKRSERRALTPRPPSWWARRGPRRRRRAAGGCRGGGR